MVNIDRVAKFNKAGGWMMGVFGIATPILASMLEMEDKINVNDNPFIAKVFDYVMEWSLYLYLTFLALFLIGKWMTRKGDKVIWETLQKQVDTLQSIAFPHNNHQLNDDHRVTLFKYKKWCFNRRCFQWKPNLPWRGWLVPVLRSGHTGKDTKALFLAPDAGREAEGIVGECWSSDAVIRREQLPKVQASTSEQNRAKYCKQSNMPRFMLDSYCKRNKPLARSILAYPVVTSTGNRWGVLVYDSMDPQGVDTINAQKAFEVVAEPLGVLVEGV